MLIATTALASTTQAPTISEHKGEVTDIPQPTSQQLESVSSNDLKDYLAQLVTKYGGNYYELYQVIQCESGWRANAQNPTSPAHGIAQFFPSTFNNNCTGNYHNPYDQLQCFVITFTEGHQGWWSSSEYCWGYLK